METKYQYRVWNDYFDYIVSTSTDNQEYAISLAKKVAVDYYGLEKQYLNDVNVKFIVSFFSDSIVNLRNL